MVAVVVTQGTGAGLEAALAALGAQDYPALSVLVVDAGSDRDPTARVAAALPSAFVRRLGENPGFGGAANDAVEAVQGATFFLLCQDDVALDPPAVQVMVEEAFRSNAAIIGPKLVDAADPSVLLEVGRAIDRLGGSHNGIEPGEVDQEQHDAVRDVFYVSSAAMLVRGDLFDELGGFDPETSPGSEDMDLCWRARLAGARIVVAPDARGRQQRATAERPAASAPSERELARRRIRVVLTCYSALTLLWLVPVGFATAFLGALAFAVTSRRAAAFANLGAWWWNLAHWGRVRTARRHAQSLRRIHDSDLHELQVGAGEGSRDFLSQHHAGARMELLSERSRDALESLAESLRHPAAIGFVVFVVLVLLGSRDLITKGVPDIGSMMPWTGVRSLLAELTSAWRHTGLGSTVAAPPALGFMSALGIVFFGSVGFAQTVFVVGAFIVGAAGAFRLARGISLSLGGGAVTAIVYGVSAVPRNDVANGRLGPLVLYAAAPYVVLLLIRSADFANTTGKTRKPLLGVAIVTALAAMWYPPALLVGFAVGIAFLVASPITGEAPAAMRVLGAALVGTAGAVVLLLPWVASLAGSTGDAGALGAAFRPRLDLVEVLRFETGPNGAGVAAWGLILAAGAALVIGSGPALAWAVRGWALAVTGFAAAYLPARLAPGAAAPAPEAALGLAALGLAIAAGVTTGALAALLRDKRVGWQQGVGALAMAGVAVGSFGFLGDTVDGQWRAPVGWGEALSFTQDQQFEGEFRILWIGDAAVLPLDPVEVDASLAYSLTRNGPGDVRGILRARETDDDRLISRAVQVARRGETSRLGRMLAPAGVRYVALAMRNGEDDVRGRTPPGVADALGNQLDLARLGSPPGLVLYENQSWAPARAVLTGGRADDVPADSADPLRAAAAVDLSAARPLMPGAEPPGTVLLAEAYDDGWSASAGDGTLDHARSFGFTNSWTLPARAAVTISHDGQTRVYGLLVLELALWIGAIAWWTRGRRREPRVREPRERRAERAPRRDFIADLADLGDDLDFWERA